MTFPDSPASSRNLGSVPTSSGFPAGQVALVGAGPGEPSAITLRAIECLRAADVVFYDYLVNPTLLNWASPAAETISLGRHGAGGKRLLTQAEINRMMVEAAQAGQRVVRLKSGDPIVFARMSEEAEALQQAGIPFEIVPGVTSALATGSYAGIPLTHRDHASAVALVTGHRGSNPESRSGQPSHLDWQALARFPGTLVIYMGTTQVEYWANELLAGGKPSETPVAVVRRCGFPDQQIIRCNLANLVTTVTEPQRIRPPVVFVVGAVAGLGIQSDWFLQRPLFQQNILLTRPAHQSEEMRTALERMGAGIWAWPAIETLPVEDPTDLNQALRQLHEFDWVVFSSANGVDYCMKQLWETRQDSRALAQTRLACIGQKTEQRLNEYHLRSDLTPTTFDADHLADTLAKQAQGQKVLLIRASRGREVLAEVLQAAGADVRQVIAYRSVDSSPPDITLLDAMAAGEVDWVTVTSSAIARHLVASFGERLHQTKLVSISPITSATLRQLGFAPVAEATTYTAEGLIEAMLQHSRRQAD